MNHIDLTEAEQAFFNLGRVAGLREAAELTEQVSAKLLPPNERTDPMRWADLHHVSDLAKMLRERAGTEGPHALTIPVAELFATPQDFDTAEFILATHMGLIPAGMESWYKHKGVFWSNNPVGEGLCDMLQALVRAGVLTRTEDEDKYVWSWDPKKLHDQGGQ